MRKRHPEAARGKVPGFLEADPGTGVRQQGGVEGKPSEAVASAADERPADPVGGPVGLVKHTLLGPSLEHLSSWSEWDPRGAFPANSQELPIRPVGLTLRAGFSLER